MYARKKTQADIQVRLPPDLKNSIKQKTLEETPLSRIADPAEVADAALFLATNTFANNCVLNLDGGLSAV
jgi:3-oxoacyl-[acyl-carrier protein] reductase